MYTLQKALTDMSNHLLFKNIPYYMTRYNAPRWPRPGCKQFLKNDCDWQQILWDLDGRYKAAPIGHTNYASGQRKVVVMTLEARLQQHRVHTACQQRTTGFSFIEVHVAVKHGCVDLHSSAGPR